MLPGVKRSVFGPSRCWTKRDCFHFMDCDSAKYWEHPPIGIQASVWRNSPKVRAFLESWMTYCLDPRIISDHANVGGLPNLDGFMDHLLKLEDARRFQAITAEAFAWLRWLRQIAPAVQAGRGEH